MVTLTFVFDKDKVAKAGTTEDELLAQMRAHAEKYHIAEEKYGVFSKDGENALCVLGMSLPMIVEENPRYINLLKEWTLNVDGEEEDCIQSSRRWLIKHNMLCEEE